LRVPGARARTPPRAGQGVMNPQHGTHGPPPPCLDVREEASAGWPTGREREGHGASRGVRGRESRPHGQRCSSGPTAKGRRFPHGKDGKVRELRRATTACPCLHDRGTAQGRGQRETGEPDDAKVSRPVRRGAGRKGGLTDLARGLPYLVPRSGFRQRLRRGVGRRTITPGWEQKGRNISCRM
jgi:hypothetical protein